MAGVSVDGSRQLAVNTVVVEDMYMTQGLTMWLPLDAFTGRVFWIYRYNNSPDWGSACGATIAGWRFRRHPVMGTLDGIGRHRSKNGTPLWKRKSAKASRIFVDRRPWRSRTE